MARGAKAKNVRLIRGTGAAYGSAMTWDIEIDVRGMLCPLPVLRLRKRLGGLQSGQVARLLATDAMAAVDVPHFCAEAGHGFLGSEPAGEATAYLVRKG